MNFVLGSTVVLALSELTSGSSFLRSRHLADLDLVGGAENLFCTKKNEQANPFVYSGVIRKDGEKYLLQNYGDGLFLGNNNRYGPKDTAIAFTAPTTATDQYTWTSNDITCKQTSDQYPTESEIIHVNLNCFHDGNFRFYGAKAVKKGDTFVIVRPHKPWYFGPSTTENPTWQDQGDSNAKFTKNGESYTSDKFTCSPTSLSAPPPQGSGPTSVANTTSPSVNNASAVNNTSTANNASAVNNTSAVNNSSPSVDNASSGNNASAVNNTSTVNNSSPSVDNASPAVNNDSPAVNTTSPAVNTTSPAVNTTDAVNTTSPSGNNTAAANTSSPTEKPMDQMVCTMGGDTNMPVVYSGIMKKDDNGVYRLGRSLDSKYLCKYKEWHPIEQAVTFTNVNDEWKSDVENYVCKHSTNNPPEGGDYLDSLYNCYYKTTYLFFGVKIKKTQDANIFNVVRPDTNAYVSGETSPEVPVWNAGANAASKFKITEFKSFTYLDYHCGLTKEYVPPAPAPKTTTAPVPALTPAPAPAPTTKTFVSDLTLLDDEDDRIHLFCGEYNEEIQVANDVSIQDKLTATGYVYFAKRWRDGAQQYWRETRGNNWDSNTDLAMKFTLDKDTKVWVSENKKAWCANTDQT